MKRKALILLAGIVLFVSCVYTERFDTERARYLGESGDIVVTLNVAEAEECGAAALLPQSDIVKRVDRISLSLKSSGEGAFGITGIANGLLSSTEVGTVLIWDPGFVRAGESPRYYENRKMALKTGSLSDGIVLFTTENYKAEYDRLKGSGNAYIPFHLWNAMESSLAALYVANPENIMVPGVDIPQETLQKIKSVLLFLDDADSSFSLSGEIQMHDEDGARTLCTLLRNLLVQKIRREGGKLDVRALSGIFTYDGSLLRISGYSVSYDEVRMLLTKEFENASI